MESHDKESDDENNSSDFERSVRSQFLSDFDENTTDEKPIESSLQKCESAVKRAGTNSAKELAARCDLDKMNNFEVEDTSHQDPNYDGDFENENENDMDELNSLIESLEGAIDGELEEFNNINEQVDQRLEEFQEQMDQESDEEEQKNQDNDITPRRQTRAWPPWPDFEKWTPQDQQ